MTEALTLAEMAANIELSRGHISKQNAIITRLTKQGHEAMADEAKETLIVVHEHLALEIEMLERMQGKANRLEQLPKLFRHVSKVCDC